MSYMHTFVVCAHGASPYLEECIKSLEAQTYKSRIIISTSTPNRLISDISQKYSLQIITNTKVAGIAEDWNFAYQLATTKYVTLAHQDDIYYPQFTEHFIASLEKVTNPIIAFCDSQIIRNGKFYSHNTLLVIKRLMNFAFKVFPHAIFARNFILSLGNPICCPSVTFNKNMLCSFKFDPSFRVSLDWEAWSRLSQLNGSFVYISDPLLAHRIHNKSQTTIQIAQGMRHKEDLIMYKRYHHSAFIATVLARLYRVSTKSNRIERGSERS